MTDEKLIGEMTQIVKQAQKILNGKEIINYVHRMYTNIPDKVKDKYIEDNILKFKTKDNKTYISFVKTNELYNSSEQLKTLFRELKIEYNKYIKNTIIPKADICYKKYVEKTIYSIMCEIADRITLLSDNMDKQFIIEYTTFLKEYNKKTLQ